LPDFVESDLAVSEIKITIRTERQIPDV